LTINKGIPRPAATPFQPAALLNLRCRLKGGQRRQSPLVKGVAMLIAGGLVAARYNDEKNQYIVLE